jgi:hypothetical protein
MTENTNTKAVATRPAYFDMPLSETGQVKMRTFEDAYMLCDWVVKAGLNPGKKTAQQLFISGQIGAGLGLDFFTSIANIMIVNNTGTIWGDAMLGLVRAKMVKDESEEVMVPILEYFSEYYVGNYPDKAYTAWCIVKRYGVGFEVGELFKEKRELLTADPEMLQRAGWTAASFSIEDAEKANLLKKAGPWLSNPKRMLMMRARAFALRNTFPDILKGIYSREEMYGTAAERSETAKAMDPTNYSEDRDAEPADYVSTPIQKPGPAAGLDIPSLRPEDDEPDPGDGPEGGSRPEPEIVEPGANEAVEKPAEDPLSPESLAGAPERPQTREAAPASQDGYVMPEIDPNDDELLPDDAVEEVEEDVPPPVPTPPSPTLTSPAEVEDAYWRAVWKHAGSDVQTVVAFKAYGAHMLNLLNEPAAVFYSRAIENIEGHVANCHAWHAKNARVASIKAEDHSPAEQAVAAAHKEEPDLFTPMNAAESPEEDKAWDHPNDTFDVPSRLLYTKDMLNNPETQDANADDYDPIRIANVKYKRGRGVKQYYEQHLDRFIEVLSSKNIDWAEWIMKPHRDKWNSIALTKALPFILDVKRRELTSEGMPETAGNVSDDIRLRSLKDKIKSYMNYDEVMFRRVLNQLKVGGNPMTISGAELLLKALEEEYRKAHGK